MNSSKTKWVAVFCLIISCLTIHAQSEFLIGGKITRNETDPVKGASIAVFKSDKSLLLETASNDTGGYGFKIPLLPADEYVVKIAHDKDVTKSFLISTKNIPEWAMKKSFPTIIANLELFERVPDVDYSYLDQPLNRYYYDEQTDNVVYDKKLIEKTMYELGLIKRREEIWNKEQEEKKMEQEIRHQIEIMRAQKMRLYLFIGIPVVLIVVLLAILRVRKLKIDKRNLNRRT